jgi:hypothetical protein
LDELSNRRVRKNGMEGNIYNCLSVGVNWDNGSMYPVRLDSLEFIDIKKETNLIEERRGKYDKKTNKES